MKQGFHKFLSQKFMEPLFWKAKGMPVMESYERFNDLQWSSESDFKARQAQYLYKILSHSKSQIPFYKKRVSISEDEIRANPFVALLEWPVLKKVNLKEDLRELYLEQGLGSFQNSTGGSTGSPVSFYQDNDYQTNTLAATYLMYQWAGKEVGDKLVKLWGAERDLLQGRYGLKQKINDFIGNRITINAFNMSEDRMSAYVDIINSKKPICIEGYVNGLYDLARYVEMSGRLLHKPKAIVSSAGVLHPHMRELIEHIFGCKVFDRYGSRDAGNIAAECDKHQGLHIFGENLFVEIVDDADREVAIGEEGRVLVTSFTNYTMPLIRYEIGDTAVKSGLCSCGRPYPLLESISGRLGESFVTKKGGYVPSAFFIHLLGVLCNDGSVKKFQAIQESVDSIFIRIVFEKGVGIGQWPHKEKVKQLIEKAMGHECDVTFKVEAEIELTPTGKHLYTQSLLNQSAN